MNTLVFSIAHNGYGYVYRPCLASQRAYCGRNGYAHVSVTRPLRVSDPALSAWLKVPLLLGALRGGYDMVMFLDADCRITEKAPPLQDLASAGPVQMARGWSGRFNSGVIVARRDDAALAFLEAVMHSISEDIPDADREWLRYENGNIIHCARTTGGVADLDVRWNNSRDPEADDFVRHYTGPMRYEYVPPRYAPHVQRLIERKVSPSGQQPVRRSTAFRSQLEELAARSIRRYPALAAPGRAR